MKTLHTAHQGVCPEVLFFKTSDTAYRKAPGSRPKADRTAATGKHLVCRACRTRITRESLRVSHQGSHSHVFCNPQGIVYELGCFSAASGCVPAGPSTTDFSWFKGFAWTISICSGCRMHLGWQYLSPSGGGFFGLILNRLAPEPD